jgi:hypothetical protein
MLRCCTVQGDRRWLFRLVTVALTLMLAGVATLALDIFVHYRLARYAALNIWGYRGPVVGRKKPDEYRAIVIGGSTAFGSGVSADRAIPAIIEGSLRARGFGSVTVVNLGFNAENAYAYRAVLQDFQFLNADLVILYGNKNIDNTLPEIMRDDSLVYRLTGYYPLLPTALREKAQLLRYGDLKLVGGAEASAAPRRSWLTGAVASVLEVPWNVAKFLDNRLEHVGARPMEAPVRVHTCDGRWTDYCNAVYRAVVYARQQKRAVLVVAQPENASLSEEQQLALQGMLTEHFGTDPSVRYLSLRTALNLTDRAVSGDGLHLTVRGNQIVGERIADFMREWLRSERRVSQAS